MWYHLPSCAEQQKSNSNLRVRGACRQKEKPQSKNYERPPPALVVPGAAPRAQLAGGRGRMENIHPSCLKCTSRFFSSGQLRLTFSSVVLAMAWGDFHCRDGKRRVRPRRVAAGQSACHPRRQGGEEMRAVRVMVVGSRRPAVRMVCVARSERIFFLPRVPCFRTPEQYQANELLFAEHTPRAPVGLYYS